MLLLQTWRQCELRSVRWRHLCHGERCAVSGVQFVWADERAKG